MPKIEVTKQAIFDASVGGWREKMLSVSETGKCVYRADLTAGCLKRCFIGRLIPDELYQRRWDGGASHLAEVLDVVSLGPVDTDLKAFADACQLVHDSVLNDASGGDPALSAAWNKAGARLLTLGIVNSLVIPEDLRNIRP